MPDAFARANAAIGRSIGGKVRSRSSRASASARRGTRHQSLPNYAPADR